MEQYLPVLVIFVIAIAIACVIPVLSWLLGPKKPTQSKLAVYECGLNPVGSAHERFSVKFYLVAILFIIFDIDIVFMYPWAVIYRDGIKAGQGLYLLAVMGIFFVILSLGLLFELRKGALDWGKKS